MPIASDHTAPVRILWPLVVALFACVLACSPDDYYSPGGNFCCCSSDGYGGPAKVDDRGNVSCGTGATLMDCMYGNVCRSRRDSGLADTSSDAPGDDAHDAEGDSADSTAVDVAAD